MLETATAYTDVRAVVPRGTAGPHIGRGGKVAKAAAVDAMRRFGEFELRTGEFAQEYLRRERAGSLPRQRAVAQVWHGAKPKWRDLPKEARESEMELEFAVDARTFWRWYQQEGPEFWADKASLKALKRDNPDMCIFV